MAHSEESVLKRWCCSCIFRCRCMRPTLCSHHLTCGPSYQIERMAHGGHRRSKSSASGSIIGLFAADGTQGGSGDAVINSPNHAAESKRASRSSVLHHNVPIPLPARARHSDSDEDEPVYDDRVNYRSGA